MGCTITVQPAIRDALSAVYPIAVCFDALLVRARQEAPGMTEAICLALGINLQTEKQASGRGVGARLGVLAGGLPRTGSTAYDAPNAQLAPIRPVEGAPGRRRRFTSRLCGAPTMAEAEQGLERFPERGMPRIRPSALAGGPQWQWLMVFFDYAPEIHKVIYTAKAIESLNRLFGKPLKIRGAFPNETAIVKTIYLAINRAVKTWSMPIQDWKGAFNPLAILIGDRAPM